MGWGCGMGPGPNVLRQGEVPRTEAGRAACMESGPVAPCQSRQAPVGRLLFDALEEERSRNSMRWGEGGLTCKWLLFLDKYCRGYAVVG